MLFSVQDIMTLNSIHSQMTDDRRQMTSLKYTSAGRCLEPGRNSTERPMNFLSKKLCTVAPFPMDVSYTYTDKHHVHVRNTDSSKSHLSTLRSSKTTTTPLSLYFSLSLLE